MLFPPLRSTPASPVLDCSGTALGYTPGPKDSGPSWKTKSPQYVTLPDESVGSAAAGRYGQAASERSTLAHRPGDRFSSPSLAPVPSWSWGGGAVCTILTPHSSPTLLPPEGVKGTRRAVCLFSDFCARPMGLTEDPDEGSRLRKRSCEPTELVAGRPPEGFSSAESHLRVLIQVLWQTARPGALRVCGGHTRSTRASGGQPRGRWQTPCIGAVCWCAWPITQDQIWRAGAKWSHVAKLPPLEEERGGISSTCSTTWEHTVSRPELRTGQSHKQT